MSDDKKALERFGFTAPDKCIKVSQCVGCANNDGRMCKVHGRKPMKYASASSGEKCPERKAED